MSESSNKALVSQFFEAMSRNAVAEAFALVSEFVSWWVPGTLPFSGTKSKSQYLQIVGAIQRGFPNGVTFRVGGLVAEGEYVAAEVESLGQHVSGKTYNNRYHFLVRVKDEQFVEVKEYMDTLHLHHLVSDRAS